MALTIAAAAGVGAAGAAAGAGPWASSLHNLATAEHDASDASGQAGANPFRAVISPKLNPPAAGQPQAGHLKLADQQASATQDPGQSRPGTLAALPPLPARPGADSPGHVASIQHHESSPSKPYTIYDSVSPGSIPSGQQRVAVYGNGGYQASWSDVHGRSGVLWIDTNGSNPGCDVLDVEPGDATPSGAAKWVKKRLTQQPGHRAIVYTMRSEWGQVKAEIGKLPAPMKSQVQYWIADPTGVPHIVPGSSATQWYWGANFDKTKALPEFGQQSPGLASPSADRKVTLPDRKATPSGHKAPDHKVPEHKVPGHKVPGHKVTLPGGSRGAVRP